MKKMKICCPCIFGLESVLKFEVGRIGGENITVSDGRVVFEGGEDIVARANICLSTAERVLIMLGEFRAVTFEQLFCGVKDIPWEEYIGKKDAFPVKGHSLDSKLHSVPDCQSIIKKAAVTRLSDKYGLSWFEETGALHRIQFTALRDVFSIYLDTTGEGLHKRGYRRDANSAPIKETLAAGIIDIARVRNGADLIDPFCGSGTFLIESALRATNTAPGLKRRFSAEEWGCFSRGIWDEERRRAKENITDGGGFSAQGYDIDPECVTLAKGNAVKAGVGTAVSVSQADIRDFRRTDGSIVICNPPYGERMLDIAAAEELYRIMGQVMAPDSAHPCYIISADEEFEKYFGKKADKRRKLYNGMLKCQLFMYFR